MVDLAYLYNVASSLSGSYPLFSSDALSKMQNVQVTPSDWKPFFYELIMFLVGKADEPEEWPSVLNLFNLSHQAASNEGKEALASIIVDTLWVIDLQFDGPDDKASRTCLAKILSYILQQNLVPSSMAKERLDPELLESSQSIQSAALFSKKQIRMNTSMLYKQQKFNLLREEPEGFSKLILLLVHADPKVASAGGLFDQILSLIGYFDLDPTRVLDLVLDVFAFSLQKEALFSDLLKCFAFPSGTIASLLSFKLSFLADRKDPRAFDGIMSVISILLANGFIDMDQVYSNLTPSDAEFEKEFTARSKKLMTASRQVGFAAASAAPSDPNAPVAPPTLGYAEPSLVIAEHQSILNQKAALLAALVQRGDIERAKWMINRLPKLVSVSVAVQKAICGLLHHLLDCDENISGVAKEWLGYLGIGLHTDSVLFTRLCRLLARSKDESQMEFYVRTQLLPSFSLCSANPALAHELWQVLSLLPYSRRFELYHEWRESTYSSCPELLLARSLSMHDTRRVMRRLAKENVKQLGRLIGKMSHCSPIVVFPVILDQLQSYDNLIQPVVESLKYATSLSFDILTYTLLESLVRPEKDRLKSDGTSLAGWLQNLAVFSGALYKRYSHADLTPLLRYIVAQLLEDNTLDLVLLSELLQKMAGLESHENIAEQQMLSTAGGPLLQTTKTALHQLKRSSQRLMTSLVKAELAVPLWILLAKFAVSAIHRTAAVEHLKLLGLLTDQCHDVFLQYTEFMCQCQDSGVVLPGWEELCRLGVQPDYAAWMRRAWERAHSTESNLIRLQGVDRLETPPSSTSSVSGLMRRAFWGLELGDLWVPEGQYEAELIRLRALVSSGPEPPALLTDATQRTRWLKEKELAPKLLSDLERELNDRRANVKAVQEWFATNKTGLFNPSSTRTEIIEGLIRSCILPRALFSPTDALFTSALLHTLHDTGASGFSSLSAFDRLIEQVSGLIFTLTEREAHCYGRFLRVLLGLLRNWHSSKEIYDAEAVGMDRPGFYQRWAQPSKAVEDAEPIASMESTEDMQVDAQPEETMDSALPSPATNVHLSYEDFRHVLYKWHLKLHKAFVSALETGDYTHIRNSIIILSHLSGTTSKDIQFPVLRKVGASLEKAVGKVQAAEERKREDLKLLAARCVAMLQAVRAHWIPEDQFHHVPPKQTSAMTGADDETGSQKRSHPEDEESSLPSKVKKLRLDEKRTKDSKERTSEKRLSKAEEAELALRKKLEERQAALQKRVIATDDTRGRVSPQERQPERHPERRERQESGRDSPRNQSRPESRQESRDNRQSSGRSADRQGERQRDQRPETRTEPREQPREQRDQREQRDRRASDYSSSSSSRRR